MWVIFSKHYVRNLKDGPYSAVLVIQVHMWLHKNLGILRQLLNITGFFYYFVAAQTHMPTAFIPQEVGIRICVSYTPIMALIKLKCMQSYTSHFTDVMELHGYLGLYKFEYVLAVHLLPFRKTLSPLPNA